MRRWAWFLLALATTTASARLTTFAWDYDPSWPAGTTIELCSNGVCANGIVGTQHTLDVPIEPGGQFDARARAVTPDGLLSDWATLTQTWPALPIGLWATRDGDDVALALTNLTSGRDTTNNPSVTASVSPASGSLVLLTIGRGNSSGAVYTTTVSGCGLTWTQIGTRSLVSGGVDRRQLQVWAGTGTPSAGSITITSTDGTWDEFLWSVDQVTGFDTGTPYGTVYSNNAGSITAVTSLTVTVSETPDAGDMVFAAWGMSLATPGTITLAELDTTLSTVTGGNAFRSIVASYDSAPDSTPAPQITADSQAFAGIAFILNVSAAAGATALPRRALDGPLFGALRGSVR